MTDTRLAVPTLSTITNLSSASRRTWWEQVAWLIPRAAARSPTRTDPVGLLATACSTRTRVASARVANHWA